MIVRFSLTPKSLHLFGVEEQRRSKVLRKIVSVWGKLGRLVVLNGENGKKDLLAELDQLPQVLRKNWKTAFKRFKFVSINEVFPEANSNSSRLLIDLADFIEVYGFALGELTLNPEEIPSSPEVILASELDEADAFANATVLADQYIPEGTLVTETWRRRLNPLVDASKRVLIIDRYCLKNFQKNNRNFESSGLRNLFKHLREFSNKQIVVYAGYDDLKEGTIGQQLTWQETCSCLSLLNEKYNSDRQNRFEIKGIPDSFFKQLHDRFMVFDYQVLELGSGMELLRHPKTWRGMTCSLKIRSNDHGRMIGALEERVGGRFQWSSHTKAFF